MDVFDSPDAGFFGEYSLTSRDLSWREGFSNTH